MERKIIFWDFDGTLATSVHLWSTSVLRSLKKVWPEAPFVREQMSASVVNTGFTWQTPLQDHTRSVGERFWIDLHEHFCKELEKLGIAPEIARKAAFGVREEILKPENYILQPDVREALDACRAKGYENWMLSNNFPELDWLAGQLGIADCFDGMIISAKEGYDKPHPGLFDIAKQRVGCYDIAYMVGDNPVADIEGGRAAGMITVLVHKKKECPCDHYCETLSDIPKILR